LREARAGYLVETDQRVPKGYKQTEVGVMPEDWEASPLPDIVWFQEGPGLRNWQFKSSGLKVINVTNLQQNGYLDLSKTERYISWEEFEKMYKHFLIDNGDVVVASSGNSYCKTAVIRQSDLPLLMNTSVIRFKVKQGIVRSYMLIYLKSKYFKDQIDLMITGGAQPNFGPAHLSKVIVPLPPTKFEQEAIAKALSDTDALIESLEQLITKKRHIKQGTMQELLSGKKRLSGFQNKMGYKRCELGLIPDDWSCMQLPNLTINNTSAIKIGPFGSALKKEHLTKDGFKVYGQENVYEKNMDIGYRFINREHFRKLRSCEVMAGDFLISMMGTVGKCMVIPLGIKEGIMDSHLLRLRLDSGKLNSNFLAQLFETRIIFDQIKQLSVGGIMEGLSSKIIKGLNLPVPKVEEQSAIAEILSDIGTEIAALETRLAKTRALKQGMMHELLTGKTRLI